MLRYWMPLMNRQEKEKLWVHAWQTAAPLLDKLRRQEIRHADTTNAILQLEHAFQSALLHHPPQSTSGLVEQQKYFARCRRQADL